MGVRAKMYCEEVAKTTFGGRVKLRVVTRGEDNKEWSAATPVGELSLSIKNELAVEFFDPSEEYFIDITRAPKGEEGMGR